MSLLYNNDVLKKVCVENSVYVFTISKNAKKNNRIPQPSHWKLRGTPNIHSEAISATMNCSQSNIAKGLKERDNLPPCF